MWPFNIDQDMFITDRHVDDVTEAIIICVTVSIGYGCISRFVDISDDEFGRTVSVVMPFVQPKDITIFLTQRDVNIFFILSSYLRFITIHNKFKPDRLACEQDETHCYIN